MKKQTNVNFVTAIVKRAVVVAAFVAAGFAVGLAAAAPASASPFLSRDIAAAKASTATGSAFARGLHAEYTALADEAYKESDELHARRFVRRALAAANGAEPAPENPRSWWLPGRSRQRLYDEHGRLLAALETGREARPRAAARAQAMFDCWVEEEHEDVWMRAPGVEMYQPEDIARCRDGYLVALREITGAAPAPAPAPAAAAAKPAPVAKAPEPAPQPQPEPVAPPPAQEFVVFFGFDKADLDARTVAVVDKVAAAAKAYLPARVSVFGHTDRAGSVAYNVTLSKRRAKAVVDALVARGIAANRMISSSFGESRPRVPTADGVAHPMNRRAEITVQ